MSDSELLSMIEAQGMSLKHNDSPVSSDTRWVVMVRGFIGIASGPTLRLALTQASKYRQEAAA